MSVFDRASVRRHRERAVPAWDDCDFLFKEVAERLVDRLTDITRRFPLALDLGCRGGAVGTALSQMMFPPGTEAERGIGTLLQCDLSPGMTAQAHRHNGRPSFAADEEWLPIAEGRLDAILSCLSLHWVNDLPGALVQANRALKPDGLFLGAMFGGETLYELRDCLAETEINLEGGLSPRTSPLADMRDAGNLLGRAGFALPTIDTDIITVKYSDPLKLLRDLRGMGETNAVLERRKGFTRRETLLSALALYQERHGDAEGRVPATFQIIYMTAWAPDASQPKPARRGSGTVSLTDALADTTSPSAPS